MEGCRVDLIRFLEGEVTSSMRWMPPVVIQHIVLKLRQISRVLRAVVR